MPKMEPLQEWICDTCGRVTDIDDGWLEWLSPKTGPHSFRITHRKDRCFKHTDHNDRSDMHLEEFVGANGLQGFLAMLDVGPILDPRGPRPDPPETRSLVEVMRRLHIPHYEEARQYFNQARADGYFSDHNEVSIFQPKTCRAIIERYEEED